MSRSSSTTSALATGTLIVGLVAVGVAFNNAVNPPSKGADYLTAEGYTHVTGGDTQLFHMCYNDDYARSYHVTAPDGRQQDKTVCFGLFGPYHPLFG